mmetsp:Transcript_25038/g.39794  ORF Transcript_25038/g.39794 Transcript_25038/m.39794 type:complete len:353 (+) Transcript_25038:84-1142(+)
MPRFAYLLLFLVYFVTPNITSKNVHVNVAGHIENKQLVPLAGLINYVGKDDLRKDHDEAIQIAEQEIDTHSPMGKLKVHLYVHPGSLPAEFCDQKKELKQLEQAIDPAAEPGSEASPEADSEPSPGAGPAPSPDHEGHAEETLSDKDVLKLLKEILHRIEKEEKEKPDLDLVTKAQHILKEHPTIRNCCKEYFMYIKIDTPKYEPSKVFQYIMQKGGEKGAGESAHEGEAEEAETVLNEDDREEAEQEVANESAAAQENKEKEEESNEEEKEEKAATDTKEAQQEVAKEPAAAQESEEEGEQKKEKEDSKEEEEKEKKEKKEEEKVKNREEESKEEKKNESRRKSRLRRARR